VIIRFLKIALLVGVLAGSGFCLDMNQYGVILGGDFARFYGSDARNMGLIVDSASFGDGRNPFGYTTDSTASPSGSIGPVAGFFVRLDWNDYFFTRIEATYLWKGDEYQKTLPAMQTYCYHNEFGECLTGQEAIDLIRANQDPGDTVVADGYRRWVLSRSYIEIPILMGYNITRELSVFAGPHLSVLIGKSFQAHITESAIKNATQDLTDKQSYLGIDVPMKRIDYGFTGGIGYQVTEQFEMSFRWAPGFAPVLDRPNTPDIKSNCFQLLASLNFSEF